MEAAVRTPDEEEKEEGAGEEGPCLDPRHASSSGQLQLHDQSGHPRKLIRTDTFPFRMVSRSAATAAGAASNNGGVRSPPSLHPFACSPNSSVVGGGGGAVVFNTHRGVSDSLGAPRTLQSFAAPFRSLQGLGGDATLQLCSPFTAAQWQELHRQALIFKYIMASAPVPPELLFSLPRTSPEGHSLVLSTLGRGGDYLNLRFTGNSGDLEPGRCRRTDGKKWRCSRDVAPGQKYCDRHMHRARPRSRKPVELDKMAGPAADKMSSTSAAASSTTSTDTNRATTMTTTSSLGVLPGPDLKFPFRLMAPQEPKLRYSGSGRDDAEKVQAATQQWQLLRSRMGLGDSTSVVQQHQHYEDQLNLKCTSPNDQRGYPCRSAGIFSSLEDVAEPHRRDSTPRQFVDAWSRGNLFGVPICDYYNDQHLIYGGSSSTVTGPPLGNLSPSNLTLSMSGTCGGGSEDRGYIQTGLRSGDSGKTLAPCWMSPVTPIGGPLAEVLQTTSSTVTFQQSPGENVVTRTCAGLIDLMSKASGGSEGGSPGDSTMTRGLSSPTGVLQKTLVSLSDSSSSCPSPAFGPGPGPRPELGLRWMSQTNLEGS